MRWAGSLPNYPLPERREEIVEQRQWAFVRLEQVKKRALGPEIVKMQALVQRCAAELEEMNQIEAYRKDEHHGSDLTIDSHR